MSESDFLKKGPPKVVQVNHDARGNEDALYVPGMGFLPLIGPSSGEEYKRLKASETLKREMNAKLLEIMRKSWQCIQCKRVWKLRFEEVCTCGHFDHMHSSKPPRRCGVGCQRVCKAFQSNGTLPAHNQLFIRAVWRKPLEGGPEAEVLVCADQKCDGPVIEIPGPMAVLGVS